MYKNEDDHKLNHEISGTTTVNSPVNSIPIHALAPSKPAAAIYTGSTRIGSDSTSQPRARKPRFPIHSRSRVARLPTPAPWVDEDTIWVLRANELERKNGVPCNNESSRAFIDKNPPAEAPPLELPEPILPFPETWATLDPPYRTSPPELDFMTSVQTGLPRSAKHPWKPKPLSVLESPPIASYGLPTFVSRRDVEEAKSIECAKGGFDTSKAPRVLFQAACVQTFITVSEQLESGIVHLDYLEDQLFDILGVDGELWLALVPDEDANFVGWVYAEHFVRLGPEDLIFNSPIIDGGLDGENEDVFCHLNIARHAEDLGKALDKLQIVVDWEWDGI